jgi:serine/threonine protein kinase
MDTGPSQTGDDELRWLLNMERRAPAVLVPGQVIGARFRIDKKLGAGGMGVVYLARDLSLRPRPRDQVPAGRRWAIAIACCTARPRPSPSWCIPTW